MHIVFLESGHFEGELGDLMVLITDNLYKTASRSTTTLAPERQSSGGGGGGGMEQSGGGESGK